GAILRSDTIDFDGGDSSVSGGGRLTIAPLTDGADIDLGGSGGDLALNATGLNGYGAGLVIGGIVEGELGDDLAIQTIANTIVVNDGIDVGDGYLTLISRDGITLEQGHLVGAELTLIAAALANGIQSNGGRDAQLRGDVIRLISGGAIGDVDGNDVWVSARSNRGGVVQIASAAEGAAIVNQ